jgi:hypothetical protein
MTEKIKRKKNNYINNKELFEVYCKYKDDLKNDPTTRIPEYIGKAILLIANGVAQKGNFSGYSLNWKEEMISDAIENAIKYAHNFNPEKSQNPFSYISTIVWYAFLRRIEEEKKEQYIRYKILRNEYLFSAMLEQQMADKNSNSDEYSIEEYINSFVDDYEKKLTEKKKKTKIRNDSKKKIKEEE